MIYEKDGIKIRSIKDDLLDYQLIHRWLSDEAILKYYEGRDKSFTIEDIIADYQLSAKGLDRVNSCIIEYNQIPIGYIQYYQLDKDELSHFGYKENENYYGIDLYIGNLDYQNQGMGTKTIKLLIEYIKTHYKPDKIIIDPRIENKRAIRCYEKCGFQLTRIIPNCEFHEGSYHDTYLMELSIFD